MKDLLLVGQKMSNVFFNWSQDKERFTVDERALMKLLQRQWDAAQHSVQRTARKRRAKGDKFDPRDVSILGGDPSL